MIEVCSLTKVYLPDLIKAVDSLSFKLERGEVGCLIGTSGCGKTTTLKLINRLEEPTQGDIWVNDVESRSANPIAWRRGIGYVVQSAGLFPHMVVEQNISLLSRVLKRDPSFIDARVKELMEIINMPFEEFSCRYPTELSGGQRQRVAMARALMEDPSVLLMDEPFSALDPITRSSLHKEFICINERLKKTVILVTHDLDEAFELGDKIILMNEGRLVQFGKKEDFLYRPKSQFVVDFLDGAIG